MPRPLFTPGKYPVPIVQEVGWAPGPVWTGMENLAHTRIRSPNRPAYSQSLYRLSYLAHIYSYGMVHFTCIDISSLVGKRTHSSTYKTDYTATCKTYRTITVHTTVCLKTDPRVRNV